MILTHLILFHFFAGAGTAAVPPAKADVQTMAELSTSVATEETTTVISEAT